jgi:hypothetical protein
MIRLQVDMSLVMSTVTRASSRGYATVFEIYRIVRSCESLIDH